MTETAPVPRLAPADDRSDELAELLSKTLTAADGTPQHIFTTLAHHPKLLKRFNAFGGLFLVHGQLPERERELVVLRTAWRSGCSYVWGQHVVLGQRAGVTWQEQAALARPLDEPSWSTEDIALLSFVDELLFKCDVRDALWAPQRARWTDAQLVELTMLVGLYRMIAGFLNVLRVSPEPELPGWPARPFLQTARRTEKSPDGS